MDGMNFQDLGAIINTLKENPALLQMLGSLMGGASQKTEQKAEPKPQGFDQNTVSAFLSMLGKNPPPPENHQTSAPQNRNLSVFGSNEEIKNRINLLNAVRPYLSETRKERLEAVIKLLNLAQLGSLSQILS